MGEDAGETLNRFRFLTDYVCTRWEGDFAEKKRHSIYSMRLDIFEPKERCI